jgi:hypothetical protein
MKSGQKLGFIVVMVALFGMALSSPVLCQSSVEDLVTLANKIQNEAPGIGFEIWTEGDKTAYQVQDQVVFGFKADKDCYLALINIGTSGKVTLLFPNKWHSENKVEKDKAYKIPADGSDFVYRVVGPAGLERVKAVACLEPILMDVKSIQDELRRPLEQDPAGGGAFLSMKQPEMVLKDIALAFSKVDTKKWATTELTFKVADAGASPAMAAPPAGAPQVAPPAAAPQPSQAQPQPAPAQGSR